MGFRALFVVTLLLVTALSSPSAEAAGFRLSLPGWPVKNPLAPMTAVPAAGTTPTTPATGNPTGLVLTLDTSWADSNGYRPIRVTVTPTTPTNSDRRLEIQFRPNYYRNAAMMVSRTIELPAGFTQVTASIPTPQMEMWNSFTFEVFEDGAFVPELSVPRNSNLWLGGAQFWGDDASPATLLLSTVGNSFMVLNALGKGSQPIVQVGPTSSVSTGNAMLSGNPMRMASYTMMNSLPSFADLPTRWIEYSSLDIILLSAADLQTLVNNHPQQWAAIRQWILTGGNLIVFDVGQSEHDWWDWNLPGNKQWTDLSQINRLVVFDGPAPGAKPAGAAVEPGWEAPNPALRDQSAQYQSQAMGQQVFQGQLVSPGVSVVPPGQPAVAGTGTAQVQPAGSDAMPFVTRPLGYGLVTAIATKDPTTGDFPWQWLYNTITYERWTWTTRNGVSFYSPNQSYWRFLIPGVGAAPVTLFQVLITLFVVGIGPLNFLILRKWQKLNLLLVTVPASAAIITVGLLLYAIFADGFGTRLRTRSITYLQQDRGEGACLGRLTFYAGLAPADGLSFSNTTAVYPLEEAPVGNQYDRSGDARRIAWLVDESTGKETQHLYSGWLNSRTQTQFMTVRARKTDIRLDISQASGELSAVNKLQTPIELLIVQDAAGKFFVAEQVADAAQFDLRLAEAADLAGLLGTYRQKSRLRAPTGEDFEPANPIFGIRRRSYGRQYGAAVGDVDYSQMDRFIREAFGLTGSPLYGPRSYLAIVARSPELEIGLDGVEEEDSFHMIIGRW